MTKIISKKTKIAGLDIHYLCGGQGEPLVVIHGGAGGGSKSWREGVTELARNYTVYVPDLPGFGYSQPMENGYFIPDMVDFIDTFTRELGLERFHLVGHSVGGGVAVSYVLRFPERAMKLVLINSLCLGREIALWVRLLARSGTCRSLGRGSIRILQGIKWLVERFFRGIDFIMPLSETLIGLGAVITTLEAQAFVLTDRLAEIAVPTLVVWGDKDPIVPVSHAYTAGALIPECQVKVFRGYGHSSYKNLPEFSELLVGFLG